MLPMSRPVEQHPVPWLYDIPLRCCVARDVPNLMFAGRNISATHVAFSSTRVMATCAVVGQGVGTAAAFAVHAGVDPGELPADERALRSIQQRLLRDDAFLIGPAADDPFDAARTATISASSEQPAGAANQVVSGFTRAVHGERGAPPDRRVVGTHRWTSDPAAGLPAWLLLEWDEPVSVQEVQLIFDTGLHRHLTLSHHDGYTRRMHWGKPQLETVRDYSIEVCDEKEWEKVADVTGNYQRLRRHRLPVARTVRKLRINVTGTNGLDHVADCRGARAWRRRYLDLSGSTVNGMGTRTWEISPSSAQGESGDRLVDRHNGQLE